MRSDAADPSPGRWRLHVFCAAFALTTAVFARESIVFVGAHPDDSEGFAATAFLLRDKYDLHVVDLTRGERGLGRAGMLDGSTARIRVAEEQAACRLLGAIPHFLCETNGCCHASRLAAEMLMSILRELKPRAIFTHWPVDGHSDHVQAMATVSFALDAFRREKWRAMSEPELYFYEVVPGETEQFPALYSVDVTKTMDLKTEMLRCYACQNADDSLVRRKIAQAGVRGAERLPPVRFAEVFTTFDGKRIPNGVLEGLPETAFARRTPAVPTAKDVSGAWKVSANGFVGDARLPGTLADAKLGTRWTERDFQTTMDLPQSEALVQEWQYVGKAIWTRTVELSETECAAPMELFLERVMWTSTAFWDGQPLGTCDSLATPHVYALPKPTPGRHELRLEIDNGNHYGFSRQSHAYGPNMQAVWNGVLGKIEIRRAHPLRVAKVFAGADGKLSVETTAEVAAVEVDGLVVANWKQDGRHIAICLGEKPVVWNEFHPQLYTIRLTAKDGFVHSVRFGFRTYGTNGRHITLNGNDIFTRGNVENANFAKDGTPWMAKDEWMRMLRTLRDEDGVNTIRFHTWCPPAAAFEAADELGIMLQPEAGIWTDSWMSSGDEVGNGKPVDGFVRRELKAIVNAYGNSPSFLSLSIGNELGNSDFRKMGEMIAELRAHDPRALYYASSARDLSGADDFLLSHKVGDALAREKLLPRTDWDYEEIYAASKVPTVAHEIGQWPVYPIWDDLLKPFTGTMRPWNLSRHRDTAAKKNALRFQDEYHAASAKLNRLIYKEEVESFLRTPSCAGLQLLNVQDYTGQAEALVGWRDPFYGLKAGFRGLPPFSTVWGPVSYLARFPKFTWTVGETFAARLQIRNLTDRTIPSGTEYRYAVDGTTGVLHLAEVVRPGALADVGEVRIALTAGMTKSKHELRFGTNRWNFWVYPQEGVCALPDGVIETADPEKMKSEVRAGKTVLYRGPSFRCGKGQFKSVYWSARWFPVDNTVTAALGTWFDKDHPALAGFVTDDFTDWQWYDLAEGGVVHSLLGLPQGYRPIGLSVNDFHFSEFAATLFEVSVGKGRLFVCGYDIGKDRPPAKRLRASIAEYLSRPVADGTPILDEAWLEREFDVSPKADAPADVVKALEPGWTGTAYETELRGFAPVTGFVQIDLVQPEEGLTSGRGLLEGRVFEVPFTEEKGKGVSVRIPIVREDMLDGHLDLSVRVMTGKALSIRRISVIRE